MLEAFWWVEQWGPQTSQDNHCAMEVNPLDARLFNSMLKFFGSILLDVCWIYGHVVASALSTLHTFFSAELF